MLKFSPPFCETQYRNADFHVVMWWYNKDLILALTIIVFIGDHACFHGIRPTQCMYDCGYAPVSGQCQIKCGIQPIRSTSCDYDIINLFGEDANMAAIWVLLQYSKKYIYIYLNSWLSWPTDPFFPGKIYRSTNQFVVAWPQGNCLEQMFAIHKYWSCEASLFFSYKCSSITVPAPPVLVLVKLV